MKPISSWNSLVFKKSTRVAKKILDLAETEEIILVIPAFSIIEARTALRRLEKQRVEFHSQQLMRHLRELSRSKPYRELTLETEPFTKALIESSQSEKEELDSITSRILQAGHVISLDANMVSAAIQNEQDLGLESPDAAVFASVMEDLRNRPEGPKCFLNRNSKDFANPDIYGELKDFDCEMIPSFEHGFRYIIKRLPDES